MPSLKKTHEAACNKDTTGKKPLAWGDGCLSLTPKNLSLIPDCRFLLMQALRASVANTGSRAPGI